MKESVTKFDFEAAFKALDEIDVPSSDKGIKANRPALTEIFSRKTKFESLFEEYYDIGSTEELNQAKEDREAEVAKAKLERIEKIVDLDAKSPEDLLTSYVGKYIIQCPQCMTLFYKNQEDVVESEDDPNTVNVSEVCQHCGNESGYTLVGKVGEATAEETESAADEIPMADEELPTEELPEDSSTEETTEEAVEGEEDLGDFDLDALNLDEESVEEEEKKEESFAAHTGEALVEGTENGLELKPGDRISTWNDDEGTVLNIEGDHCEVEWDDGNVSWIDAVDALEPLTESKETDLTESLTDDKDLDAKLKAHNEYIEYLRATIADEEAAIEKVDNEQVKAAIQRRIDAYKVDLEAALPDEVKNSVEAVEEPVEEPTEDTVEETMVQEESLNSGANEALTEALKEDKDLDVSADEFEKLINEPEFKKPISDSDVRAMMIDEKKDEETDVEEALEEGIFDNIKNKFSDVKDKFNKFIDTQLKSRSSSADWVLKNALIDYTKAAVGKDGNAETEGSNRKFNTFIVIGYKGVTKNNQKLKVAPKYNSSNLVVGMKYPEAKKSYADAEKVAKGWSMVAGNGPAFIYLAKNDAGDDAAFLCQYFEGKLDESSDQLNTYVSTVRSSLEGGKLQAKGGVDQSEFKNIKASETKPGMKAKFKKGVAEVVKIEDSDLDDAKKTITLRFEDGSERATDFGVADE